MIGRSSAVAVAVLATVVPVLSACSARANGDSEGRPGLARNALPGLVGRHCEFSSQHADLPSFADLARLGTRGNIALWGTEMAQGDTAVVSIRYGDDGRLVWVRAIQSSMARERLVPLERLLMQSLNERGPADWGVRVRFADGDLADMEPSVVCPPEVGPGGIRTNAVAMPVTTNEYAALISAQGRHFPVQIALDERGRVLGVRLERPSGEQVVDQFLVDWVLATDFHPKLHDGIALSTTFTETLYLPRRRR